MSMLAAPDTITGPLMAADLDRSTNKGRIYSLHRIHCEPGAVVSDDDCERMAAEACTEIGAEPAGKHRRSLLSRAWLRLVRWMA